MSGGSSPVGGPRARVVLIPEVVHIKGNVARIRIGKDYWDVSLLEIRHDATTHKLGVTQDLASKVKTAVIRLAEEGAFDLGRSKTIQFTTDEKMEIQGIHHSAKDETSMSAVDLSDTKVKALVPTVLRDVGTSIKAAREGKDLSPKPPSSRPTPSSPTPPAPSRTPEERLRNIASRSPHIWFYDAAQNSLTSFMGNFHPCGFEFDGVRYKCAEAAFQAQKFTDRAFREEFRDLDGDAAFHKGQIRHPSFDPAWDSKKDEVMMHVLRAKFGQNPELKAQLLATGSTYLIEHNPVKGRDNYWSDDNDGSGQNKLGILLMQLRAEYGGTGEVPKPSSMTF
jgi:N-glycosidase YbiA